jgi:catechol 2,3-dioxygenase-like lactoylglutathione lyase family enzyme
MRAATVFYYVTDFERALTFYTEVLGLPLKHRFGNQWAEVDAGPITIGLHPTEDGDAIEPGGGTVSFTVDDIEECVAALQSKGATVSEIKNPRRGKFAMITDPDGNKLHVIEFAKSWKKENRYG